MTSYGGKMNRRVAILMGLAMPVSQASMAQCRLCAPASPTTSSQGADLALTIEVETALDFSRASGNNGGSIAIDERSGARQVAGLVDLGGIAIKGGVRLTGTPGRHVRVSLPAAVHLTAPDGSLADAVDLRTDLGPSAALGADGSLSFTFGGRLLVHPGASGEFRGRIPIVADYN